MPKLVYSGVNYIPLTSWASRPAILSSTRNSLKPSETSSQTPPWTPTTSSPPKPHQIPTILYPRNREMFLQVQLQTLTLRINRIRPKIAEVPIQPWSKLAKGKEILLASSWISILGILTPSKLKRNNRTPRSRQKGVNWPRKVEKVLTMLSYRLDPTTPISKAPNLKQILNKLEVSILRTTRPPMERCRLSNNSLFQL